jgi:hypothetical protein
VTRPDCRVSGRASIAHNARGGASVCVADEIGKIWPQTSPSLVALQLRSVKTLLSRFHTTKSNGARALLAQAVEAEVADFLGRYSDLKTRQGHRRIVRHGHLPEREVMTGISPVAVRQPRVRDREASAADPGRIRFTPAILPPYVRRSKSVEALLPLLHLKGISNG